jgi:hypothetical protein
MVSIKCELAPDASIIATDAAARSISNMRSIR